MQSHGLSFQKKFGQNFLINPETPRRIAEAGAGENTLEIGPGIGTLTRELAALSHKVVAVEIDSGLMPVLSETLGDLDNVQVINQDILKVDLCRLIEESFGSERVNVCAKSALLYHHAGADAPVREPRGLWAHHRARAERGGRP